LWAGLASAEEQAEAVKKNLGVFERAGGLAMSNRDNGVQWDYPYGWAPTQLLAIEGCAIRISGRREPRFLQVSVHDPPRISPGRHDPREVSNVVTRSSESHIEAGYNQNVVGIRLDQRRVSGVVACSTGGLGRTPGEGADEAAHTGTIGKPANSWIR